ncbi:LysR family transcriptional regulator [Hyphomicrobium facile]|uniref:DNA-binding transcriptional regulator, LysR family n=1 Tax=Hyphomicrobium facile TaxID=51670 RepID=A0A1I7NG92_9HYPH|nr:LysR family transcriptional regulator [Hyphomicrobium facile]SFV33692.1 DNA-binding transcriptional regulator, LysR family [Hyphomicrobium facile]
MAFDGRLLSGVTVLSAVIEGGSFVRAADSLGITTSGVSRAISRLEERLGARLLDRTTRSVSLTDEGRRFYERVKPSLADIEDAATIASGAANVVRGRLRVNIDPVVSQLILPGRLGKFLELYPELSLDCVTREQVGDLVGDGIDVAVRFGEPPTSSLIIRKLAELQVVTVAAPSYLKRRGRPEHPNDLAGHACIDLRDPLTRRPYAWEFHKGRKVLSVKTESRLLLSDAGTMLTETLAGTGIAQVFEVVARDLIKSGRLVDLFPAWADERFPLYAYYPSRHHPAAKVRAFVDFILTAVR